MSSQDTPLKDNSRPSAPLVGLLTWLVPGGGYLLLGQKARGITIGLCIIVLFVLGIFIGGLRVVDPPSAFTFSAIMAKPWYMGQVLTGAMGIICGWAGGHYDFPFSHSRVNEIGTLYTAVAGMLNLMAIIDSCYRAIPNEPAAEPHGGSDH